MLRRIGLLLILLAGIQGCSSVTSAGTGALVGAIGGGAIGSTIGKGATLTAATIIGTVAGGFLGKELTRPHAPPSPVYDDQHWLDEPDY